MNVSMEELSDIKIDISELTSREVKRIAEYLNKHLFPDNPRPTDFLVGGNPFKYLFPVSKVCYGRQWGLGMLSNCYTDVYTKKISGRDVLKEVVDKV